MTLAHVRWALLNRCGKDFALDLKDDELYWKSMESLPIGFLGGESWNRRIHQDGKSDNSDQSFQQDLTRKVKDLMLLQEPNRWRQQSTSSQDDSDNSNDQKEDLPSDDHKVTARRELGATIEYQQGIDRFLQLLVNEGLSAPNPRRRR